MSGDTDTPMFFSKKKNKPESQRRPAIRHSISFSIAYVRVCEWARDPDTHRRPKPDILDKAVAHARKLGDTYILQKIADAYEVWETVNETPTPKDCHPKSSQAAQEEADRITDKIRTIQKRVRKRQLTQPYSLISLSEAERVDLELEQFLQDMSIWDTDS